MPGLSHALVPAQESKRWSFGRLLLLPVIQKGLFWGPKKSRKIGHANTGLPSRANIGQDVGYMGRHKGYMGQHKATIGASLRQHRANIGQDVGYMGRPKAKIGTT